MVRTRRDSLSLLLAGLASLSVLRPRIARAKDHTQLDRDVTKALNLLYGKSPRAKELRNTAKGILVFPRITKAGFMVGGAVGEGALRRNGKSTAYYLSSAGSFGLQIGVQWFGYALFLMTDKALEYLDKSDGWELGVGPSVVFEDKGAATKQSSTTLTQDVHAFIFGQNGLFAGAGIEGSKITKLS